MLGVARWGPLGLGAATLLDAAAAEPTATGARPDAGSAGGAGAGAAREDPGAVLTGARIEVGSNEGAMAERDAWTVLASIPGLGPVGLGALLRRHGSGRSILEVAAAPGSVGRLTVADERGRALVDGSLAARIAEAALAAPLTLDRVRAAGLLVLTLEDAAYPARLRAIEMPPHVLFVRGSPAALAAERAVAVVGTRRPTERGRRLAGRLAAALARAGASIVSGLAVGIDGAAHAAAVSVGGPTVAVLGSGHERLFPRAHARLADAIVDAGGAIVSELPPEAPAAGWTFPRRNRVVSGLSEACLVVEAPLRSGALITAGWALEQGRECFLVPGPLDEPASAGCLAFLRAYGPQARLVADVAGLLEDLGLTGGQDGPAAAPPSAGRGTRRPASAAPRAGAAALLAELGEAERASAVALIRGRSTVDELVAATEQPVATVLGTLTLLEMRGLVVTAYGRYRPAGALATLDPSAVVARLSGRPAGG